MFSAKITGDKALDRKLSHLSDKGQARATKSAIGKALTVIARGIRNAIPPNLKSVKKTVGTKNKKNKRKGIHEAKVGLGVGKQKKQARAGKPGVGISKANVHWWALGTGERQKKDGQSTGAMPEGPKVVKEGYLASQGEARKKLMDTLRQKISEEAKKG